MISYADEARSLYYQRPMIHFMRLIAHYYSEALNTIGNDRLKRVAREEFDSFFDNYDYTKEFFRFPDRRFAKFALTLESIANGRLKPENKRHVLKIMKEIEQAA